MTIRHQRPQARITALVLAILAAVLTVQPAAAEFALPRRAVTPAEISLALASLNADVPVAAEAYVAGKPAYDDFFLRAAKIHGTLVVADSLISKFGVTIASAANGVLSVPNADPAQWPDLVDSLYRYRGSLSSEARMALESRSSQLSQLLDVLPNVADDATKLASDAPNLMASASQDFRGLSGILKLPKVIWSVKNVASQLASDEHHVQATLGFARSLSSGFSGHAAASAPANHQTSDNDARPTRSDADNAAVGSGEWHNSGVSAAPASDTPEPAYMPNLECDHLSGQLGTMVTLVCRVTTPTGEPAPGVQIEFTVSEGGGGRIVGRATSGVDGIARYRWPAQASLTSRQMTKKVYYYAVALPSQKIVPAHRANGDVLVAK